MVCRLQERGARRPVQEAIDAVPRGNQRPYTIQVRKEIYFQRITMPREKPFIPQSRTYPEQAGGSVFDRFSLTGENTGRGVYLRRPWRAYSQVVYRDSWRGSHIRPEGWSVWNNNNNHENAFYAEYESEGPGANPNTRVSWSNQLTQPEAARFALLDFLKGTDGWNPGGNP